jgi:fibronectin type 3 domain-containing protein
MGFLAALLLQQVHADNTFVYAVQISATVRTSPPQIVLQWQADPYGANNYTVYRTAKDSSSWGTGVTLSGSASSYTDNNVALGGAYEYQIVKAATLGYTGYGYIYSGISAPVIENRGKLILIVADTHAATLSAELSRLQSDLTGDGWQVIRHDVSSANTPANVKNLIIADYNSDPANVKAVFLFGHVPIFRSGTLAYDAHGARAMPADGYYGDMDGNWGNNPSYLPSDVELMVGRVDLFNMPGNGASPAWPNEAELLRRYLNKDHAWRHKLIAVPRRALMGNRDGDKEGEAGAACGYRNFQPFVGPGNIIEANVQDNAPVSERWISFLTSGRYLWAYGNGGGDNTSISQLGTHGLYNDVWSSDIVGQDAQAVFTLLYGSHLGEWDLPDNIMRSILATPTMGLTCAMGGRPHWYLHHMGLGEPIGYGARLTMNNSTLYRTQTNAFTRGVHIGLIGDPALRMDPVAPPSNLTASRNSTSVNLTWSASADTIAGYHIYRSGSAAGPFTRLTTSLVNGTSFADTSSPSSATTYMVRAIKLQTNPSGSYYNASQGIFATVGAASPAIRVTITRSGNNAILTWNSQAGTAYHVLSKDSLAQTSWTVFSGTITATGPTTSWTAVNIGSRPQRFFKISSP